MPTSTKVFFKLDALKDLAVASLDERIAVAESELATYDDDAQAERVASWRTRQEQKLSDVFRELDTVSDLQLATFRLDPYPDVDRSDRSRARRWVEDLRAQRSQIAAKASALVPDADGNIALTKTQLSEIFGL